MWKEDIIWREPSFSLQITKWASFCGSKIVEGWIAVGLRGAKRQEYTGFYWDTFWKTEKEKKFNTKMGLKKIYLTMMRDARFS